MSWLLLILLFSPVVLLVLGAATDVGFILAPLLNRTAKRFGLQGAARTGDEYRGKEAVVVEPLEPSNPNGKVQLHGSLWSARLARPSSGAHLEVGDIVVIEALQGLTFLVSPKRDETQSGNS